MRHSLKTGFSFGLTSGIITTLGLMVGLYASTASRLVVIGGILTIAIADSLSEGMGIHISEESENQHTTREIWESTLSTIFTKGFFTLTFAVPILFLSLKTAIIISMIWGFSLLLIFSYYLAKKQNKSRCNVIGEHLIIAVLAVVLTHFLGNWINKMFG